MTRSYPTRRRGVTLIEVLVTLLVISLGLLGLAGLQVKLESSEVESFQRSQALLLLNDMANRMTVNRNAIAGYVTGTTNPLGASMTCPTAVSTLAQRDLRDWCSTLQGVAETKDGGATKVVALIGGRGCVEQAGADYMITVAWQGLTASTSPPTSVACGSGNYNGSSGSSCQSDRCRRVVTTLVRVAAL